MAVPATNGQLRTTLSDMKIGDYIVSNYQAASGAVGTFSNFGGVAGTEIPLVGSATPNGSFYFIKTEKGLLVSDRVVQHTITWDTLNAGKVIQGFPWATGNIIPVMTSNNAPSGIARASSEQASYPAFNAFGGADRWMPTQNTLTGWLSYEFPTAMKIKGYRLLGHSSWQTLPKDWTFEGSNDGTNWTILDTQRNVSDWASTVYKNYPINNDVEYKTYRINVTANNGNLSWLGIYELEMYEKLIQGSIRSLTGGVAFADANGNSSTTDQSKGAFPTNNEWDKYIVNFPIDKIQVGKTLSDVFNHLSTPRTWTQDTPMLSLGVSANRIARASTMLIPSGSTTINNSTGFRPAFEYKEV
jgi:hypothetical protein